MNWTSTYFRKNCISFKNINKSRNADILLVDVSPYMYVVSVFFLDGTVYNMTEIIERLHSGCYFMIALRYK